MPDLWVQNIILQMLLGAACGYATNNYAVKMIFHQYRPLNIKLGGLLVEKKPEFAEAMGQSLTEHIFTESAVAARLQDAKLQGCLDATAADFFNNKLPLELAQDGAVMRDGLQTAMADLATLHDKKLGEAYQTAAGSVLTALKKKKDLLNSAATELAQKRWPELQSIAFDEALVQSFCRDFLAEQQDKSLPELITPELTAELCKQAANILLEAINSEQNMQEQPVHAALQTVYAAADVDALVQQVLPHLERLTVKDLLGDDTHIAEHWLITLVIEYAQTEAGTKHLWALSQAIYEQLGLMNGTLEEYLTPEGEKMLDEYIDHAMPGLLMRLFAFLIKQQVRGYEIGALAQSFIAQEDVLHALWQFLLQAERDSAQREIGFIGKLLPFAAVADRGSATIAAALQAQVISAARAALVANEEQKVSAALEEALGAVIMRQPIKNFVNPGQIETFSKALSDGLAEVCEHNKQAIVTGLVRMQNATAHSLLAQANPADIGSAVQAKVTGVLRAADWQSCSSLLEAVADNSKAYRPLLLDEAQRLARQAAQGKLAPVIAQKLAALPDADLEKIMSDFMESELKPINVIGAVAGGLVGAMFGWYNPVSTADLPMAAAVLCSCGLYGLIGYATNVLAIKMVFEPYEPWRLLGLHVPCTPGIFAKKQPQLAVGMADFVQGNLLNEDGLRSAFADNKNAILQSLSQSAATKLVPLVEQQLHDKQELFAGLLSAKAISLLDSNRLVFERQLEDYLATNINEYMSNDTLAPSLCDLLQGRQGQIGEGLADYARLQRAALIANARTLGTLCGPTLSSGLQSAAGTAAADMLIAAAAAPDRRETLTRLLGACWQKGVNNFAAAPVIYKAADDIGLYMKNGGAPILVNAIWDYLQSIEGKSITLGEQQVMAKITIGEILAAVNKEKLLGELGEVFGDERVVAKAQAAIYEFGTALPQASVRSLIRLVRADELPLMACRAGIDVGALVERAAANLAANRMALAAGLGAAAGRLYAKGLAPLPLGTFISRLQTATINRAAVRVSGLLLGSAALTKVCERFVSGLQKRVGAVGTSGWFCLPSFSHNIVNAVVQALHTEQGGQSMRTLAASGISMVRSHLSVILNGQLLGSIGTLLATALYEAVGGQLKAIVAAFDIRDLTEQQVKAMHPRELRNLFYGFGGPYFAVIERYGMLAAPAGLVGSALEYLLRTL